MSPIVPSKSRDWTPLEDVITTLLMAIIGTLLVYTTVGITTPFVELSTVDYYLIAGATTFTGIVFFFSIIHDDSWLAAIGGLMYLGMTYVVYAVARPYLSFRLPFRPGDAFAGYLIQLLAVAAWVLFGFAIARGFPPTAVAVLRYLGRGGRGAIRWMREWAHAFAVRWRRRRD